MSAQKTTIMVSSTVYGIEELLERIYTLLISFGYEVWMSHSGTMQTYSNKTAFENCLDAVEKCDLFLGLITPQYGSGQDKENVSGRRVDQGVRFQGSGAEDLGLSIRRRIDVAVILNRCLQRCAVICRLQLGSRFSFRSLGGHLGI